MGIPVILLHVNRLDRQLVTTLGATRLQYFATVLGLHTLAEAVNARTATNFRLVSPFR